MYKDLPFLVKHLSDLSKMDFSHLDDHFLLQTIERRLEACGLGKPNEYMDFLSANPEEVSYLIQSLKVTYTEFFRNSLTYGHLEQWLIPTIVKGKTSNSELRIWSVGCSTGQEPYSIAVLLERIKKTTNQEIRYRIIATDNNDSALMLAQNGHYNQQEIQNVRYKDIEEYFVKKDDKYSISTEVKNNVSFSHFDLLQSDSAFPEASIFGSFDLVICCNLLYYYKPKQQQIMIKKLVKAMADNGYLITGETEKQAVAKCTNLAMPVPPSPIFQSNRGVK